MKTLIELGANGCRWPVSGDLPAEHSLCREMQSARHLFCGEPADTGCPYCAKHRALAYEGPGRDIDQLERMMKGIEKTVTYAPPGGTGLPQKAETTPDVSEIVEQKRVMA